LYWLDAGTRRFNELRRLMPEISHKVLSETLRNLEREGLVSRTVYPDVPPRVEYGISDHGESVPPIIQAVPAWGHQHLGWGAGGMGGGGKCCDQIGKRERRAQFHALECQLETLSASVNTVGTGGGLRGGGASDRDASAARRA